MNFAKVKTPTIMARTMLDGLTQSPALESGKALRRSVLHKMVKPEQEGSSERTHGECASPGPSLSRRTRLSEP